MSTSEKSTTLKKLSYIKSATLWILSRAPFVNATMLLFLLAERAESDKRIPFIPATVVYVHLALFIACGGLMSLKLRVKEASFVYCGQLIYFLYTFYSKPIFAHDEWIKIRCGLRQLANLGIFLYFAGLHSPPVSSNDSNKARSRDPLRQLGTRLMGVTCALSAYCLIAMPHEQRLVSFTLGPNFAPAVCWLLASFLSFSGFSLTSFAALPLGSAVACCTWLSWMCLCELQPTIWRVRYRVDWWMWARMLSDSAFFVIALLMVSVRERAAGALRWKVD